MPKASPAAKAATKDSGEVGAAEAPAATAKAAKEATSPPGGAAKPTFTGVDLSATAASSLSDQEEFVNGLWYGREGSGKTTDVLTAANYGRVLVVNAEAGIKKKPLREFGINLDNIVPWPPQGREEELTVENLEALSWQIRSQLQEDPKSWYAVVWDSTSEIYETAVANERVKQYDRNLELPVAKQKEHRLDPYFTDLSDYGTATAQMRGLLRKYRDLPCHFLMTALERRDVDEETSKVQYGPAVGPAFQKDILGMMDVNIYCEAGELRTGPDSKIDLTDEFVGRMRTDGKLRAKDRFRSMPRILPTPTFERVLDYIEDRVTEETDPMVKEWHEQRAANAEWIARDRDAVAERRAAARGSRKSSQSS